MAFSERPPASSTSSRSDGPWATVALTDRFWLLESGIGKTNAAAAVAHAASPGRFGMVINLGICGALPGGMDRPGPPTIGQSLLASASVYADEGVQTPDKFLDCAAMGFPLGAGAFEGSAVPCSPMLRGLLEPLADRVGPIATVSTCSGTDALAHSVVARTGALAEAMEGAAIGHVLARLYGATPAFAELRVVSNTTGNRAAQSWDLKGALAKLTGVTTELIRRLA